MSSRKQPRKLSRAERLAQEHELAVRPERAQRLQTFGGLLAVAAVIIAVIIAISSSGAGAGSASGGLQNGKQLTATERSVTTLLAGIPQTGTVLGDPSARVTMTYYGDLECPVCRDFTLTVFPTFVRQEVRTGKVKVDYRSLCTATCGPGLSTPAAQSLFTKQQVAAYAAGAQHRFWNYAELFYHQQGLEDSGYVTESYLEALARQAGLKIYSWQSARTDPTLADQVAADQATARRHGLDATPTLILRGPKGRRSVTGIPSASMLTAAVRAVS